MSKARSSKKRRSKRPRPAASRRPPGEDRATEAITVAWTVSVTMVFLVDVVTIAAHFFSRANPDAKYAPAFEAIMLVTGCVMGTASLALLPVVWWRRRVKPPRGYLVFAVLVAVAPIIVTVVRLSS